MPTDNTFLAAATAADVSSELILASGDIARVSTSGLAAGETIQLEAYQGSAWLPVVSESPVVLSALDAVMVLHGPGQFRFRKPVTAAAVGIFVDQ